MVLNFVGLEISVPEMIWTIISFVIFYAILKRVLFKPLLTHMYEREDMIKEGKEAGKKAQEALDASRTRLEADLEKAQTQARNKIIDARRLGEKDRAKVMEEADRSAQEKRIRLQEQIQRDEVREQEEMQADMQEFVSLLTNKMLQTQVVTADSDIVADAVNAVKEK